mgnify:CR=1 FL=1
MLLYQSQLRVFTFQYASIKPAIVKCYCLHSLYLHFNMLLLNLIDIPLICRLKVYLHFNMLLLNQNSYYCSAYTFYKFTFQYASIKPFTIMDPIDDSIAFTFQYASIKPTLNFTAHSTWLQFTFQYASIKPLIFNMF